MAIFYYSDRLMQVDKNKEIVVYKKHSLTIRWTHWINFPLLTIMIISGFMIYWANDVYTPFIDFTFYNKVGLSQKLALGMGIHFVFMWLFALNGVAYTLYLVFSGQWREHIPKLSSFRDALLVTLHDLKLRRHLPAQDKFNGAQKIAYFSIAALGFVQLLTGLAIYKPVQLLQLLSLFGGYENTRFIHFIVTVLFILFFLVHLLQVVRAGWNNFRSMITGTEEITESEIQRAQGIKK